MMNLIKTTITRLSHTSFYNKLKEFLKKTLRALSIQSSVKAIWLFFRNTIYMGRTKEYSRILYSKFQAHKLWHIDALQFNNFIEIKGWAIPPQGNHLLVNFTMNDKNFDRVKYPILREDVRDVFWYSPHSEKSGFSCRSKLTKEEALANGPVVFKFVNNETRQSINDNQNYYYFEDNLILPDARRRKRVHGNEDEVMFRFIGYTTYAKLELILKKIFNKSYNNFSNISNWGCGCGRIARYFNALQNTALTGVDIDADNINWCTKNLGFGRFLSIPLHPPTELTASAFDLLIGISVFTHLAEKEQDRELEELRRVASDGAILLMTIHSDSNVGGANFPLPAFNAWWKEGLYVVKYPLPDFEQILPETAYYKVAYHTHAYIRKHWSTLF